MIMPNERISMESRRNYHAQESRSSTHYGWDIGSLLVGCLPCQPNQRTQAVQGYSSLSAAELSSKVSKGAA